MIDLKIGQVWQKVDPRYANLPHKTIIGFAPDGRVILESGAEQTRRTNKAKPDRFHGKRGGYQLIKDVT
jgi:hypothetical protein